MQEVIELAIGGRTVTTFFDGERRFDVTVRYAPEARTDPTAIGSILVTTRDGGRVPLSQLAEATVVVGRLLSTLVLTLLALPALYWLTSGRTFEETERPEVTAKQTE